MRLIGITGGIGSGKSAVLELLRQHYHAHTLKADRVAHLLMSPGGATYRPIIDAFGQQILGADGTIDRKRLGAEVFASGEKLALLNKITHPAVRAYILDDIAAYRKKHPEGIFVLEAALLIEEGYGEVCDELWYVYACEETRITRLREGRGYAREKSLSIIRSQSEESFYRLHCKYIIDNGGSLEKTKIQIDNLLMN